MRARLRPHGPRPSASLAFFFCPHPKGCIHDGWRGRSTKLEYLILNQDFPLRSATPLPRRALLAFFLPPPQAAPACSMRKEASSSLRRTTRPRCRSIPSWKAPVRRCRRAKRRRPASSNGADRGGNGGQLRLDTGVDDGKITGDDTRGRLGGRVASTTLRGDR